MSADVPHVEFNVLVRDCFDVEADGRDGRDGLVEFEFIENGCGGLAKSGVGRGGMREGNVLVFPAASSPSMRRRISLEPNSFVCDNGISMFLSWIYEIFGGEDC